MCGAVVEYTNYCSYCILDREKCTWESDAEVKEEGRGKGF